MNAEEQKAFADAIVAAQYDRFPFFRGDDGFVPPLVKFIEEAKDERERFERAYCVSLLPGPLVFMCMRVRRNPTAFPEAPPARGPDLGPELAELGDHELIRERWMSKR